MWHKYYKIYPKVSYFEISEFLNKIDLLVLYSIILLNVMVV